MGFLIRPKRNDPNSFYLIEETWDPKHKKINQKTVKPTAYIALGFRFDMTTEEAKARASQINKQSQIELKKIVSIAKRVEDDAEIKSAYLPEQHVLGFESELRDNYSDNPERLNNVIKQWSIVQKMIAALALDTQKFYDERQKFYNYYREKAWSPDYIKKLNRLTNLYGQFVARRTNQFYKDIPRLSSNQKEKIIEIRESKEGIKTAADPLMWNDLKNVKSSFENEKLKQHWNWLFIGLWFGLRPKEIDSLTNVKNWKIETDNRNNVKVLMVYQSKLTSVTKEKRWKTIPVYFTEQQEALKFIINKDFKRPLNKTLKRLFNSKIETYSPRKGFTDLMLEKGFGLEDISVFLGHADISMTWKHYKNKMTFKLPDKAG